MQIDATRLPAPRQTAGGIERCRTIVEQKH
jgi:hypothetical protein